MTQGQVNTLRAFSGQLIAIFMQQFYGVIPVYCNHKKRVTKGVLFLQVTIYCVQQFQVILTIRVNYSF